MQGERPRHTAGRRQGKRACQRGGRANEGQRKGYRTTKPRKKREVASRRARDERREGGTASTRAAQHRNKAPERGAPEGQAKGNTQHHGTHRTGSTHTTHTNTRTHGTRPAVLGSPPRGRAAGERGRLNPDAPCQPRGAQSPNRHAGHGAGARPPHPHTRAHRTWVADPDSPPRGRAAEGGGAPDPRRPSQRRTATPPGTPFRHFNGAQCWPARGRAVGPVLGPHARTDRTRDTRVAEPWLPAPEDGRQGEGQRLTPDDPHNGGRPPPPGTAPHQTPRHAAPSGHAGQRDSVGPPHPETRAHSTWVADPNSPPSGRAVRGGTAPDLRRPSRWWKAPLPGTPFRQPHSEQRWLSRAHAVGPMLGPHARTNRTKDTRVAEPWLPAPEDGRPGEGQRLTPEAPHNGGRPPLPGMAPHHPRSTQPAQGMRAKGTVLGPHLHTPAPTARGWRTPTARPVGGQSGKGQRLASDAPHNGGRHPPRGRPSATPTASNAGPQGRTLRGWCWVPTPAPTAPGTHGPRNPGGPLQRTGGRGRDSA